MRLAPQAVSLLVLVAIAASCSVATESQPFELYTHCGLDRSLIEFEESYWDPTGPGPMSDESGGSPPGFGDPFDHGTIARTGAFTATFVSSTGVRLDLVRLLGRPDLGVPCR